MQALMSAWTFLNGKKTYIVAGVVVAYAVVEWWAGAITQQAAFDMIAAATGLGALRHGVAKAQ